MHKNTVYKLELDNSYLLEKQLSESSKKINTEVGITNYISIANQFICSINRINALNETYIDTRARTIRILVTQLLIKKFDLPSIQNNNQEEVVAVEKEEIISICPTAQLKRKTQQECKDLLAQSKTCIQQINGLIHSKGIIDYTILDQTIFTAQLIALNIYDLPTQKRNAKQFTDIITNLETKITQAQDFIKNQLIQAINHGDLYTLRTVFEHGKHNLTIDLCLELLNKIKSIKDITKIDLLLEVCDFLHNNSAVFKTSIIIFSMLYTGEDNIVSSAMFDLYRKNNLLLFKKLIEYGANCRIGMYDSNNNRRLPLLNAILCFESGKPTPDFSYVDELLTNACYPFTSGESLSKSSYVANNQSAKNTNLDTVFDAIYKLTPLEIALDRYKNNINAIFVNKLISLSSLESLALSLAWFISINYVKITPAIASDTRYGVYLCSSTEEEIKIRAEQEHCNIYDRLFFLITMQAVPGVVNNFSSSLCNVHQAFLTKISQLHGSDDNINSILQNLTSDANHKIATTKTYKFIQYSACLFLLAQKPVLNLHDAHRSFILLTNIAKTYHNYALKPDFECKLFSNAYNFLHKNKFLEQLADTNTVECEFITNRHNILRQIHQPTLLSIALAVKQNKFQILQQFISNCYYSYLDINAYIPGNNNRTLLHYACESQGEFLECAQILILLGSSIGSRDTNNKSPLDLIPSPKMRKSLEELSNIYNTLIRHNTISVQHVTCMLQQNILMLQTITEMLHNKYSEVVTQPVLGTYRYKPNVGAQNIAIRLPAILPDPRILINSEIKALLNLR